MNSNGQVNGSVDSALAAELARVRRVVGVQGAMVASLDGRAIGSDLPDRSSGRTAAISASSLALAARLGELTSDGAELTELQARTTTGYVCLYSIGPSRLLVVVTDLTVNLALLKLDVRDVLIRLAALWPFDAPGAVSAESRSSNDPRQPGPLGS